MDRHNAIYIADKVRDFGGRYSMESKPTQTEFANTLNDMFHEWVYADNDFDDTIKSYARQLVEALKPSVEHKEAG